MPKYKLGKQEDGKQIVEKSQHTMEFYADSLIDNVTKLRKMMKELAAQVSYNGAEIANLEHHNPWLKDMSNKKLKVGFLYERAMGTKAAAADKLKEVEVVLKQELQAILDIKKDTGYEVVLPDEIIPVKEEKKDVK